MGAMRMSDFYLAETLRLSEWVIQNWEYVLVVFYAVEKIVKMTPTKYDDILFDMLLKPVKEKLSPKK